MVVASSSARTRTAGQQQSDGRLGLDGGVAGVRVGDIITTLDGNPPTPHHSPTSSHPRQSANRVAVDYFRAGTTGSALMILTEQP
jgi:hypothetical protein